MSDLIRPTQQFIVGDVNTSDPTCGVIRVNRITKLSGKIKNNGTAALVFSIQQSADNGVLYPYAAVAFRVNSLDAGVSGTFLAGSGSSGSGSGTGPVQGGVGGGSYVSSISVVPGGFVEFDCDEHTEQFLRFLASPQPGSRGMLTIYSPPEAYLTSVGQWGVPYNAPLGSTQNI